MIIGTRARDGEVEGQAEGRRYHHTLGSGVEGHTLGSDTDSDVTGSMQGSAPSISPRGAERGGEMPHSHWLGAVQRKISVIFA